MYTRHGITLSLCAVLLAAGAHVEARMYQWVSPRMIALRNPDAERVAPGVALGLGVLKALGFSNGFTHMEWFLTPKGEAVFGEIGCRPPGARSVDIMNYACDFDAFTAWAEAVCHGRISQPIERRWNACQIVKRAHGEGRMEPAGAPPGTCSR